MGYLFDSDLIYLLKFNSRNIVGVNMKEKLDNDDKLITDILNAENIANQNLEKAEMEAKKIVEKASITVDGLREKTIVKLKNETAKLNKVFEEQKHEQEISMQENSKAEISKLSKNIEAKKQEIATQIVKEILTECQ